MRRNSFTDGQRRVADEAACKAMWGGAPNGERFRCYLCGHRFVPGDGWRWQNAVGTTFEIDGETFGLRNFMVCDPCDGPDVLVRWKAMHVEFYADRFWALRGER